MAGSVSSSANATAGAIVNAMHSANSTDKHRFFISFTISFHKSVLLQKGVFIAK